MVGPDKATKRQQGVNPKGPCLEPAGGWPSAGQAGRPRKKPALPTPGSSASGFLCLKKYSSAVEATQRVAAGWGSGSGEQGHRVYPAADGWSPPHRGLRPRSWVARPWPTRRHLGPRGVSAGLLARSPSLHRRAHGSGGSTLGLGAPLLPKPATSAAQRPQGMCWPLGAPATAGDAEPAELVAGGP